MCVCVCVCSKSVYVLEKESVGIARGCVCEHVCYICALMSARERGVCVCVCVCVASEPPGP